MGFFDGIGNAISSGINDFEQEVSNVAGQAVDTAQQVEHQVTSEVTGAASAVGNFFNGVPGEINSLIQEGEGAIGGLPGAIQNLMADIFSGRSAQAASAKSMPGYAPASGTGKAADPSDTFVPPSMDEATAMYILQQNFDRFDTAAGGPKDGLVSKDDLKAILADPNTTAQMKVAAQYLLQSPTGFNQAETAQFGGNCDGLIGRGDVQAFLDKAGYSGPGGMMLEVGQLGVNANKAASEWTAHTAPKPSPAASGGAHTVHGSRPVDSQAKKDPAAGSTKADATPATDGSDDGDDSTPKTDEKKSTKSGDSSDVKDGSDDGDSGVVTAHGDGTVDGTLDAMAKDAADQLDDLFAQLNGKNLSDRDFQTIQLKINHLSQIMTMVSNMEKELHDLRMSVINNIR